MSIRVVQDKLQELIDALPELDGEYEEHGENAPVNISFEHHVIHDGYHFIATDSATINNAETRRVLIRTPAATVAEIHLYYEVSNGLGGTWIFYEDTVVTDNGTALTAYNSKRDSTTTANLLLYYTPTVTTPGTAIATFVAGSATTNNRGGGNDKRDNEIILKPDSNYMLQFTSGNNNNPVASNIIWYELTYA